MFNLGPGELLVIAALIFIFIKPEELPGYIKKAGNLYGRFRLLVTEVKRFGNSIAMMADASDVKEELPDVYANPVTDDIESLNEKLSNSDANDENKKSQNQE